MLYLAFWLLSVGLIVRGGFDRGHFFGPPQPFVYPYREVLLLCAVTGGETIALYWILGLRSCWGRTGLFSVLAVWSFLGHIVGGMDGDGGGGGLGAFSEWSALLCGFGLVQLIVPVILLRRATGGK